LLLLLLFLEVLGDEVMTMRKTQTGSDMTAKSNDNDDFMDDCSCSNNDDDKDDDDDDDDDDEMYK